MLHNPLLVVNSYTKRAKQAEANDDYKQRHNLKVGNSDMPGLEGEEPGLDQVHTHHRESAERLEPTERVSVAGKEQPSADSNSESMSVINAKNRPDWVSNKSPNVNSNQEIDALFLAADSKIRSQKQLLEHRLQQRKQQAENV